MLGTGSTVSGKSAPPQALSAGWVLFDSDRAPQFLGMLWARSASGAQDNTPRSPAPLRTHPEESTATEGAARPSRETQEQRRAPAHAVPARRSRAAASDSARRGWSSGARSSVHRGAQDKGGWWSVLLDGSHTIS